MKERSQPAWLVPTLLIGSGCLILLCLVGAVIFGAALLFGAAPAFGPDPAPVETNSPSAAQIAQCRQALGILAAAEIDVEWFYYQTGFLDDSLQCRLTARAAAPDEIFDSSVIDLTRLDEQQQVAAGRYVTLDVVELEPGLYLITGSWFET